MADPSIDNKIARFQERAYSANTRRAYGSHQRIFKEWCAREGIDPLNCTTLDVKRFVVDVSETHAQSTVGCILAGVSDFFSRNGRDKERICSELRLLRKGIWKDGDYQPKSAPALMTEDIQKIVGACKPGCKRDARDKAIILVGFAGALRRHEIIAIRVEDLKWTDEGLDIRIPRSKEDQEGAGATVSLCLGQSPETCPVSAMREWLRLSKVETGPVFRKITTANTVGRNALCGGAIGRIVAPRAHAAGLAGVSAHSLRAGFVTTAYKAGVSDEEIMQHTRHKTHRIMRGYVRRSRLNGKAAAYLGL